MSDNALSKLTTLYQVRYAHGATPFIIEQSPLH
jgi:hypothetical protein